MAAYDRVEGLHLRQAALRVVPPLAVLATNGAGWLDLAWIPRHDAPLAALGLPAWIGPACSVAGALLVVSASVLRVRAKGVLVRKTTVTTGGVYGLVRHPFYLATLLGGAGTFAVAGALGALAGLAWLALALPVFLVTIAGEEAGLRRIHGPAWDVYAAAVPRLLPRAVSRRIAPEHAADEARVTWANLVVEGEPPRGLRFLAGALAVLAFRLGGPAGVAAAAVAAALFAGSHVPGLRRATTRSP